MALGIVSEEDWDRELNKKSEVAVVVDSTVGRGNVKEVPEVVRNIVGEEKVKGEVGNKLAELFGLSESSISAYSRGMTSSNGSSSGELSEHIGKVRAKVKGQAADKLSLALDNISEDKLSRAKLGELSTVARNMAAIVKDMDEGSDTSKPQTQIIFVAPHIHKEEHYDVIDVSARDQ